MGVFTHLSLLVQLVSYITSHLVRAAVLPFPRLFHRLLTTFICGALLPVLVFTTLTSSLFRLLINHMAKQRPSSRHHRHHTPTASSSSSSASSSSSTYFTLTTMDHHHHDDHSRPDMHYWLERCSICFEARLDLCLDYCRDQFCLDCFQRYVAEVVGSSWGLSVTKIRCPVCQVHIPQSEWSKFVPSSIVDQYNKFNRPYRSFSRCCPRCETEMTACEYKKQYDYNDDHARGTSALRSSRTNLIQEIIMDLLQSCPHNHTSDSQHRSMVYLLKKFEQQQAWRSAALPELYKYTMSTLIDFTQKHLDLESMPKVYAVSRQILLLDMKPEIWKRLQFAHIGYFPSVECSTCQINFCLQCGYEDHPKTSCEERMQVIADTLTEPADVIETTRWKLKHSRRCPSCSIMINRDEGCNKVECSLCGFCFCWMCRSAWSEKCGFYRCIATNAASDENSVMDTKTEAETSKTELGVPNVSAIQSRLFSGINVG